MTEPRASIHGGPTELQVSLDLAPAGPTNVGSHNHHYGASAAAAPSPAPEAEEHGTGVVGDGTGVAGMSAFPSPPEERNVTLPAGDPHPKQ